jgi:hypothetical protein
VSLTRLPEGSLRADLEAPIGSLYTALAVSISQSREQASDSSSTFGPSVHAFVSFWRELFEAEVEEDRRKARCVAVDEVIRSRIEPFVAEADPGDLVESFLSVILRNPQVNTLLEELAPDERDRLCLPAVLTLLRELKQGCVVVEVDDDGRPTIVQHAHEAPVEGEWPVLFVDRRSDDPWPPTATTFGCDDRANLESALQDATTSSPTRVVETPKTSAERAGRRMHVRPTYPDDPAVAQPPAAALLAARNTAVDEHPIITSIDAPCETAAPSRRRCAAGLRRVRRRRWRPF